MAAIFCKRPRLLHQSVVLLHENARPHTPNWRAVYGCTSDRLWISPNRVLSVLSLNESLRSTWLANDCNRCWCEGSYHLLARHLTNVFTLEYKLWSHCGANTEMVVVTALRSDVYHLLHMCHVVISHNNILTWQCLLPYFLKVLFFYTLQSEQVNSVFWMVEFLCHLLINVTMNYLL